MHNTTKTARRAAIALLTACLVSACAWAGEEVAVAGVEPTAPAAADVDAMPGLTVNREAGYVDLDAVVVGRDVEWLELVACSPQSREHESLVTVSARPSHVHLALMSLGLEPGAPLQWEQAEDAVTVTPPHGPVVEVFFVYTTPEGETLETPANDWVVVQPTGETLADNRWVFAGSLFRAYEGQELYMADLNGTVVSLVSFGDDLVVRPTTVTNQTDQQALGARPTVMPPNGTALTMRLRPVPDLRIEPAPEVIATDLEAP